MRKCDRACARCGVQCESAYAAWRHCQKPRAIAAACRVCGKTWHTTRAAIKCCQRTRDNFQWHGYESIERRYLRLAGEIRADQEQMRSIRLLAEWLLNTMPE